MVDSDECSWIGGQLWPIFRAKKSCNFGATGPLFDLLLAAHAATTLQNQALAFTSTSTRNIGMDHLGLASNHPLAGHVLGLVLRWSFFYRLLPWDKSPFFTHYFGRRSLTFSTHLQPNPRFVSMKTNEPTNSPHPTPPPRTQLVQPFFSPGTFNLSMGSGILCPGFFSKKNMVHSGRLTWSGWKMEQKNCKMYFLLKMWIFQPAMLVYHSLSKGNRSCWVFLLPPCFCDQRSNFNYVDRQYPAPVGNIRYSSIGHDTSTGQCIPQIRLIWWISRMNIEFLYKYLNHLPQRIH